MHVDSHLRTILWVAVLVAVLKAVLDQHNSYRAKHQVAPLAWSNSLAARAQNWANGCVFQHSGSGENLAMGHASFQQAVNDWYAEVRHAEGGMLLAKQACLHCLCITRRTSMTHLTNESMVFVCS